MSMRGFTLIETMVAIAILTIAVAGPLYVADRVEVAAETSRDQLIANYLAQEGIEYVRAMRDHEFISAYRADPTTANAAGWSGFVSGSDAGSITSCSATTCTLDPTRSMGTGSGFALAPCSGASCTPLYLSNGVYTEQSPPAAVLTPFTRTIQVVTISASDVRVVSTVSWSFHSSPYMVSVTDHLTPWQ